MSHPATVYGEVRRAPLALSVSDAAEALGISVRTLYRLIAAGELVPSRVGRRLRIRVTDLDAYLDRTRGAP